MNKKILFALFAGTMLSAGTLFAEETVTPASVNEEVRVLPKHFDKEHHKAMAAKMAKDLGLSDKQKAQAEKIREDGHKKIAPLMEQMKNLRQQIDEERRANMQDFEKILTPEQREKFEAIKKQGPRFAPEHKAKKTHKMMRGMHKVEAEELMPPPPPYDDDAMLPLRHKHFAKKTHKLERGGFVENLPEAAEKGGFVED